MQSFERAAQQKAIEWLQELMKWVAARLWSVAAAVILPEGMEDIGLDDSKKLSAKREIFEMIKEQAVAISIIVDAFTIDKINIYEVKWRWNERLNWTARLFISDAMRLDTGIPEEGIIKGREEEHLDSCGNVAKG